MRNSIPMLITVLWLAAIGTSQAAPILDLSRAAHLALERAPSFSAAMAARDAAMEDKNLGRAGLLPYVKWNTDFAHYETKYKYDKPAQASFLSTDAVYNQFRFGVTLVQPLFRLDRWAGYVQGKLSSQIGDLKLSLAQQALLLQVAQSYTSVLIAQEDLFAAQAQQESVSRLYEQAHTAYSVGTATVNDALEAKSRLDLVKADRIQAENELDTARAQLASLIGESGIDHLSPFSSRIALDIPPADARKHWKGMAMQQALSVLLAHKKLEYARQENTKALGTALPNVDLVAGLNRDKVTDSQFNTGFIAKTEELGVQLEVPLYAGGATRAQLRKTRKLEVEAEYELSDAKRKAGLMAADTFLRVRAAASRVRALEQALKSAKKARQAAQEGYKVGLRTIVERLDAEERVVSARRNLARSKAQFLISRLQLAASVGRLNETAIEKENRLLAKAP